MRSIWKGPYITQKVYTNLLQRNKKVFYLKKKNNIILPEFVGLTIKVYNGKKFFEIYSPEIMYDIPSRVRMNLIKEKNIKSLKKTNYLRPYVSNNVITLLEFL